jgi:hypothetical protein
MTAVPSRDGPLNPLTATITVPGPLPSAGEIETHGTLLAAIHGQPGAVETATVLVPPAADAFCPDGAIENVQPSDCVMLNRCPAIVSAPLRGGPVVAATSNMTAPLPRPSVTERI